MTTPRRHTHFLFLTFLAIAFAGFTALGIWQVQRLDWKLDLIERVESRVHAPPVPAPGRAEWPRINADDHEYLHVRVDGHYLPGHDTRVQAVTDLGPGFWLLEPFETSAGDVVLINRGFVPPDWSGGASASANIRVTGLLRISEPGGGFLRRNDPANERWYSRDVQAIAQARRLDGVAPYFIDADADVGTAGARQPPVAGLTVVRFRNHHLVYALTWFALALMAAAAVVHVLCDPRRLPKRP